MADSRHASVLTLLVIGIAIFVVVAYWYGNYYFPPFQANQIKELTYYSWSNEREEHWIVEIESPLAERILSMLSSTPIHSERNSAIALETRKRILLSPIGESVQIWNDDLILQNSYGIRTWHLDGIETQLDGLLKDQGRPKAK